MTNDIDSLMDSVYNEGTTSITKEKVNILRIFMQRAFPDLSKKAISDASALLAVYCCLMTEGKHISVNGHEMDAEAFSKFFDAYIQKTVNEFQDLKAVYDFYGSALVVAMYVYKYTHGLTNKTMMFNKTRAGDSSDRIAAAIDE